MYDPLEYNHGDSVYIVVYKEFFKVGVTNTPYKRVKAIVECFGADVNIEESHYYSMPESLANAVESKVKKEFENYEEAKAYKTECFHISDLQDLKERIVELTTPFGEDVEKHDFIKHVSVIKDEYTGKAVLKNTSHLYSSYKLIMNNKRVFDEMFKERLERDNESKED